MNSKAKKNYHFVPEIKNREKAKLAPIIFSMLNTFDLKDVFQQIKQHENYVLNIMADSPSHEGAPIYIRKVSIKRYESSKKICPELCELEEKLNQSLVGSGCELEEYLKKQEAIFNIGGALAKYFIWNHNSKRAISFPLVELLEQYLNQNNMSEEDADIYVVHYQFNH